LDETLVEWKSRHQDSSTDRQTVQLVLRQIGEGDFSSISFDVTNGDVAHGGRDQEILITQMMNKTMTWHKKCLAI
jgi:hypothetical protein